VRFVVIAGPASSGKMPLARRLISEDATLALVHRDDLRAAFGAKIDEWHITLAMGALAHTLLRFGYSVIVCAWNLEPADRQLWTEIADEFSTPLEWLDVRQPEVAALIPPLKQDELLDGTAQ
jgi:predicted kinase